MFRMMFIGLSESLWVALDCKPARSWLKGSVALAALDVPLVALVALSGVAEAPCMW